MQEVFTDYQRESGLERDVDCTPLVPIIAQLNELGVPIKVQHLANLIVQDFHYPESTNIDDVAGRYLKFSIPEIKIINR